MVHAIGILASCAPPMRYFDLDSVFGKRIVREIIIVIVARSTAFAGHRPAFGNLLWCKSTAGLHASCAKTTEWPLGYPDLSRFFTFEQAITHLV